MDQASAVLARLVDMSQPLDVALLDSIVNTVFHGTAAERDTANSVLMQFQQHPDSWTRVANILETSSLMQSKYVALQILEAVIKYRWKSLPRDQCEAVKSYILNLIISLCKDDATLQRDRAYIGKLNLALVQIIKQEWPKNWTSFIPEICAASRTSESLCENNINILKLLSEEVFDFSAGEMTQSKIKELKTSLNAEFSSIFQLCEFVLTNSVKPSLLSATLQCLLKFLNWIPLGYIFETTLIENLIIKFFPVDIFRNDTLKCLCEIAALSETAAGGAAVYQKQFENLFVGVMRALPSLLNVETVSIVDIYERAGEAAQTFIQDLALFFVSYFRAHLRIVERPDFGPLLIMAHRYLVEISKVDDVEVFKTVLEYWQFLAEDVYRSEPPSMFDGSASSSSPGAAAPPGLFGASSIGMPMGLLGVPGSGARSQPRRSLFAPVFSQVRAVMVSKMAKPEEVLIVEDENGEIIKEHLKDVDAIQLYKSMRETLIYLTNLDWRDTEEIMVQKLDRQVDGSEWSWKNLNTLCWAIGSISGAMTEEEEKRFLVRVIKDLLSMCEVKRGKDNKAVIASNIMYVVGQYPRFLRAHWKFLKTVVNKLFEFMHEKFEGVQDMAVDTFLKISSKCRRKFVTLQTGEEAPFIHEIVHDLPSIISDLQPAQIQVFYEAVGTMLSAADPAFKEPILRELMALPNSRWTEIMAQAGANVESLRNPETMRDLANLLRTNVRVATAIGAPFISQLGRIFFDMLNAYKAYSGMISAEVATKGMEATKYSHVRAMRAIKKESLRLLETFIERCEFEGAIHKDFVPHLLEATLLDYKAGVPDARDAEVLSLMAVIFNRLRGMMTPDVPRILDCVFECTLAMITVNFQDYPEHRIKFYTMLRAVNSHCFPAFLAIPPTHFKMVMDSIVWAFRHDERNIAETGLNILLEFLKNVSAAGGELANGFCSHYFITLLRDVFIVLTDSSHKSGFKLQCAILQHMFGLVERGELTAPLFDASTQPAGMTNQMFLREHVLTMISSYFPHMTRPTLIVFINGLFDQTFNLSTFKAHVRDFLVQLKEFAGDEELSDAAIADTGLSSAASSSAAANVERMASVPGLLPQYDAARAAEGMAE